MGDPEKGLDLKGNAYVSLVPSVGVLDQQTILTCD